MIRLSVPLPSILELGRDSKDIYSTFALIALEVYEILAKNNTFRGKRQNPLMNVQARFLLQPAPVSCIRSMSSVQIDGLY
jgi:hypothetical protein